MKKADKIDSLEIFQLAKKLSNIVWNCASKWSNFPQKTVGIQLVKAADSIGANIAEGYGRHFYAEKLQFFYYARGSLEETKFWISIAKERKLLNDDVHGEIEQIFEILPNKLNAYINYIRKSKN